MGFPLFNLGCEVRLPAGLAKIVLQDRQSINIVVLTELLQVLLLLLLCLPYRNMVSAMRISLSKRRPKH